MRLSRIVSAFVALILAATMSQALVAPAQAALPKHDLSVSGKEIGNTNKFIAFGKVPTFPSGKIKILRKVGGGGYKTFKKIKTKANGAFRVNIAQSGRQKTCFKVQVPGTASYKKTTGAIGCIVSI